MKKIFVLGYFGYTSGKLDGQTAKTRSIYNLLERNLDEKDRLTYYDTEKFRTSKLSIFDLFWKTISCTTLVIVPCSNNMRVIFPVVFCLSKIFRFEIIHIAIGSWQPDFFRKHPRICSMAKRIKVFFSEVKLIDETLKTEFGFTNGGISPNFRIHDFTPEIIRNEGPLRLVFMSRINKMKGIGTVFGIADHVAAKYGEDKITIDFFGPILEAETEYFHNEVKARACVRYLGVLQQDEIYKTLNHYDALLLPTFYTEGFPGAILDAYISGIPVIVSRWIYSDEFVKDGSTGLICDAHAPGEFFNAVDTLYSDRDKLFEMKQAAWKESEKYSEAAAWNMLKPFL